MKKRIIGLAILVLIVFGGYYFFQNFSATGVNSESIQFTYEEVPNYDGSNPYVVVNDNKPYFTSDEITKETYVKFGPLDSLKRVTSAMACLGTGTMPDEDEKRSDISSIHPTGWNNVKYDCIQEGDGYCQNRAHCIAWCLSGSNAEKRNLITGSPYMNSNMNVFEVRVARYIERTDNHVMYRVTPIFKGEELMCRGVLMEAYSVEDNGQGICFNVFLYNVQPGISYDYYSGESKYTGEFLETAVKADEGYRDYQYILNSKSMLIHTPDCENAGKIGSKNKVYSNAGRDELIGAGYSPAECCNP